MDATGGGNIRYTLIRGGDDFAVGATNGLLSLTLAQSEATTLTAGVQISDAHIGSESNADNGGLYVAGGRRIAIYIGAAGDNHHLR